MKTPPLTHPHPSTDGEGNEWQDLFEIREDGEYHCLKCRATFPVHSPERARNHAWVKHGIEIQPEVVVLKVNRQLPEQRFEFKEE